MTLPKQVSDRFDEKFREPFSYSDEASVNFVMKLDEFKQFLAQELELARKQRDQEIIKYLEGRNKETYGDEKRTAYNECLDEIINWIKI